MGRQGIIIVKCVPAVAFCNYIQVRFQVYLSPLLLTTANEFLRFSEPLSLHKTCWK